MLSRPARPSPFRAAAAARIKAWTRERFLLGAGAAIVVSEKPSPAPGFPPRHTLIAFWDEGHYHLRVWKPIEAVTPEDLPPRWYKPALAIQSETCECC